MARDGELQEVDVVGFLRKKLQKLKTKMAVVFRGSKVHYGRLSSANHKNLEISGTKRHKDIKKDYKFSEDEFLGRGGFGCVRVCKDRKTGERFACKIISKRNSSPDALVRQESDILDDAFVRQEKDILKYLSGTHQGILNLKDFYEDSESFYLVMELCRGGQLKQKRVREDKVAVWMKEIMSALNHCHAMGIVHRDIKPQNILLTASGTVKLIDFGLAIRISGVEKLAVRRVGTPEYAAPEIVNHKYYSGKVDVWSAGVILYNLLSGMQPYYIESFEEAAKVLMNKNLNFDSACWKGVSPEARDLAGKMLCKDPSSRLSAEQVLNHPWITIHNTSKNQSSKF